MLTKVGVAARLRWLTADVGPIRTFAATANKHRPHLKALTAKENFDKVQIRKHAPSLPATLRQRKRILVLDTLEDVPREMQKLKDAMFQGKDAVKPHVMQNHWSSLLSFVYKHMFSHDRKRVKNKFQNQTKRVLMADLGMPPNKPELQQAAGSNAVHMKTLEEVFAHLSHYEPSPGNYTMMMTAYERAGFPQKAILTYRQMRKEGIEPDMMTFNALVKSFGSMGNSAEAVGVLDEMAKRRLYPDIITYTTLINIFAKEQDVEAMLKTYGQIQEHQVRPTVVTLTSLVNGLAKASRLREAVTVFEDFKNLGIKQNEFAFNAMIWAVARKGDVRQARGYLEQMAEAELRPNLVTYKAMMNAFAVNGAFRDALDLHAAVLEGKFGTVRPCDETYNLLLNMQGNSPNCNVTLGLELYREAQRVGCFKDVLGKGQDRVFLAPLCIGTVSFAVQTALYSYVDRREAYRGKSEPEPNARPESLLPLDDVSHRGLLFMCGADEARHPILEHLVKRPSKKLQSYVYQESASVRERVEAELEFLGVPYVVKGLDTSAVRIIVSKPDLIYWTMKVLKIPKNIRVSDEGEEARFTVGETFVYKKSSVFDRKEWKALKDRIRDDERSRNSRGKNPNRERKPPRKPFKKPSKKPFKKPSEKSTKRSPSNEFE